MHKGSRDVTNTMLHTDEPDGESELENTPRPRALSASRGPTPCRQPSPAARALGGAGKASRAPVLEEGEGSPPTPNHNLATSQPMGNGCFPSDSALCLS
jgi:hypothetical protein